MTSIKRLLFKDEVLNGLAEKCNIAQFISFSPTLGLRFSRMRGLAPNYIFTNTRDGIAALLKRSPEDLVNIRTYRPEQPEGNPFFRKMGNIDEIMSAVGNLSHDGYHIIVNETVNESDGGVSGVCHAGQIEFAPDTTPRCVDNPEIYTARLPYGEGSSLLHAVYGFKSNIPEDKDIRTEFSLHPKRRGWRNDHTIIWQQEFAATKSIDSIGSWPNAFSRFLGDKVYGLLIAWVIGLPVPRTAVYNRRLFQFSFGAPTGSGVSYTRTAPEEKTPGFYPSYRGWADPFAILADYRVISKCDNSLHPPYGVPADITPLASVLVQEEVNACYSGRLVHHPDGTPIVDGVEGGGENFMLGSGRGELPLEIIELVEKLASEAKEKLGRVEFEWVYDGAQAWIVQLHRSKNLGPVKVDISEFEWVDFHYLGPHMIEEFRNLARSLKSIGKGINVIGNSSPLSHLGEIAIHYGIPARFEE